MASQTKNTDRMDSCRVLGSTVTLLGHKGSTAYKSRAAAQKEYRVQNIKFRKFRQNPPTSATLSDQGKRCSSHSKERHAPRALKVRCVSVVTRLSRTP